MAAKYGEKRWVQEHKEGGGQGYTQADAAAGDVGFDEVHPGSAIVGEYLEFVRACERYQKRKRRKFLRHTDYLVIAKAMGYRKCSCNAT